MALIETKLAYAKETKGTFVFKNDDDDAPIASLYIAKSALNGGVRSVITVTVTDDE